MSVDAEAMLTVGGDLHVVDLNDDDAPLLQVNFSNEWDRRFRALHESDKLMLGNAIAAVTSQTFKNR